MGKEGRRPLSTAALRSLLGLVQRVKGRKKVPPEKALENAGARSATMRAAAAAGAAERAWLLASSLGSCASCSQIPGIPVPAAPHNPCCQLPPSQPPSQGLLSILLQTMDTWVLWLLLLPSLVQYPQPVGNGLDEVTRLRMEVRAKLQEEEKIHLQREVEQLVLLKQGVLAWGDLLSSARQHWQLWALAGLLLLLLALWYMWRKGSLRTEEQGEAHGGVNEEDDVGNQVQEFRDRADNFGRIIMERVQWPVQDLQGGCMWTRTLMEHFAIYFRRVLSNSFYPVLQGAIGVGSAFEGWSPREQDVVYQVLIPMTPPRGHSFHLELGTAWQRRLRNFHIRVQQECTCTSEQQGEHMLCFLHHPEEELRRHQDPSLLHTLCTGSYLDVEKTARWFYQLVRAIWPALLESHSWHLVLLPPRRSCQFKVTNGRESYRIEVLFGLRQGNSDVFVSSQPRQAHTSSTIWPESYAVAEMKFFRYIARQAPPDSLHLKCLQFFTRLQLGLGFSTYTIKTIVMHLLSILPASQWRRRHFVSRLMDISESLRTCVARRRLNHFIVGNQRLPEGIRLPPEVLMARSRNLFHDLVMDPVAHSQAMNQYMDLQHWFKRILRNEQ
ncbi:LOW QUALITY PROTEIN: inositol 1,4,5-trisphosphate receptor-interacting protein-like 1 [Ammospiza nelsoni]|uniref:LOW QUALITY PROTEIN: inositol 1,4,5-trisphosphate receptor-interacting protein-like 1 n=1 Tax=Ammospiza nelsoni TaxID=2857394 RepID=UPI00286C290A|nr:LOW QUALITY PROTEIN: inositol 1,4,5-trisphosphate receptor-interacting protein-like 1 [Ammospiza nelsoni]